MISSALFSFISETVSLSRMGNSCPAASTRKPSILVPPQNSFLLNPTEHSLELMDRELRAECNSDSSLMNYR